MKKLVGETTRFIYGIGGQLVAEYDGSSGIGVAILGGRISGKEKKASNLWLRSHWQY